jgi:two-component system cell cycle sensor histidine kinase/response regulator CckA
VNLTTVQPSTSICRHAHDQLGNLFTEDMSQSGKKSRKEQFESPVILTAVGLALFYWVLESFLYFFYEPEVNFIQHLLGHDLFEVWTRLLVLCLFVIFGSHVQYTIDRRKRVERELDLTEQKYKSILENIEEGYFELDLAGNMVFFNRALLRLSGYSTLSLTGLNNRSYSDPETARRMFRLFNRIYRTGEPVLINDYPVYRRDGTRIVVELSASLMRNDAGEPVGFRGVVRDISERHRAEEEKKKLAESLQQVQKMEAIGTLASGIAHDFNNILMGMMENLHQVMSRIDPADPFYKQLNALKTYIEDGSGLTRQLLSFAKGGTSSADITDLNNLVGKTAMMFGRTKTTIRIHTVYTPELWPVRVDKGQIEQVLLNLYVNAWQAMPSGGELHIETKNVALGPDAIKPFELAPGEYACVSITDTGIGMSPMVIKRIFEPFYTTKGKGHGTGLGLATAYRIIENHKGGITVHSEPDRGATFTLYLPANRQGPSSDQ